MTVEKGGTAYWPTLAVMAGSRNLIVNPTFIWGSDHGWQPLCCSMSISDKLPQCGGPPSGHQFYCIAHNRTQLWQGIAQDVTSRLKAGVEYKVEACVSISGNVELADVRATLKLENIEGKVTYTTLARFVCALSTCILRFLLKLVLLRLTVAEWRRCRFYAG